MAYINGNKILFSPVIRTGGNAIIDVSSLPTTDINANAFYRTSEGIFWYDGEWHNIADGGSGGVSSWNDLTDKPFGEEAVETFSVSNKPHREMGGVFSMGTYGLVTDTVVPAVDELGSYSADVTFIYGEAQNTESVTYVLSEFVVENLNGGYKLTKRSPVNTPDAIVFVVSDYATFIANYALEVERNGIYAYSTEKDYYGPPSYSSFANVTAIHKTGIKTLDEKYIPDTIARVSDIPESGTSTGSGFTVDTVACFDFGKPPASVEVQQDGILWGTDESEIELEKDGKIEFATPPFFAKVPIVSGDGIEFEPITTDEGAQVVKINADVAQHITGIDATTHLAENGGIPSGRVNLDITQDGIIYALDEIEVELDDGYLYSYPSYKTRIPLVSGQGIKFTLGGHDDSVVINATGGGSTIQIIRWEDGD